MFYVEEINNTCTGTVVPANKFKCAPIRSAKLKSIIPQVAVAAFQSQRDVLLVAICSCLTTLANKLLAKFVITREIFDKACNPRNESRERAAYLLGCVQDRIKTEPDDFVKVVDILDSEPTLTRQAKQLEDSYRKCIL